MNVLNIIIAYFLFMAAIQVRDKLLQIVFSKYVDSTHCLQRSIYWCKSFTG